MRQTSSGSGSPGHSGRAFPLVLSAVAAVVLSFGGAEAQARQGNGAMAERLAAVKQNAAANQQSLRKYSWVENIQIALKGEVKGNRQMGCQYGADGKPACNPIGAQPQQPQQRGIRGRIAAEKKEDLQEYMQLVKSVIGMYVPPQAELMEHAFRGGNVSLAPQPAAGESALTFKNYAQQGDSMSLDFAMAAKKLAALQVNTYVGDPSNPVRMAVQFAPLPDGTNHPAQIVVNAPAKNLQVTIDNSNYQRIAP